MRRRNSSYRWNEKWPRRACPRPRERRLKARSCSLRMTLQWCSTRRNRSCYKEARKTRKTELRGHMSRRRRNSGRIRSLNHLRIHSAMRPGDTSSVRPGALGTQIRPRCKSISWKTAPAGLTQPRESLRPSRASLSPNQATSTCLKT